MKISLVIPCYNEAANLPLLVERCARLCAITGIEVILVDNGSTDLTPKTLPGLLEDHNLIRTLRVPVNQGYGYGILSGLREAKGDIIGWTHADLQTDPMDIVAAKTLFDTAPDSTLLFVKGLRWGRPFGDVAFTMAMAAFETVLLGTPMRDINAQPTMFPRAFFESWFDPPNDFSLDLFAYYMARRAGLKIARIPVQFGERAHGASHWNLNWSAKWRFIRRTIGYSIQLRRKLSQSQLSRS